LLCQPFGTAVYRAGVRRSSKPEGVRSEPNSVAELVSLLVFSSIVRLALYPLFWLCSQTMVNVAM